MRACALRRTCLECEEEALGVAACRFLIEVLSSHGSELETTVVYRARSGRAPGACCASMQSHGWLAEVANGRAANAVTIDEMMIDERIGRWRD